MAPKIRKHESGCTKRKRNKKIKKLIEPQKGALDSEMIDLLVMKGPKRDRSIVTGPKDKFSKRFTTNLYTRTLSNGEKCDRDWLVYSTELDIVFCFCCKVFKKGIGKGQLTTHGFSDWHHVGERLKEHEIGMDHVKNMATWYELRLRLKKNETIDKTSRRLIEKEKEHWENVLKRIIAVVNFLATSNLAFRGSNEILYEKNNGNFLRLIQTLAEFDPFVQEHVRRNTNDEVHSHYLGHNIQNELILVLASAIKAEIVRKAKQAKYFFVILDCTPDAIHQEQMSLIIRYVDVSSNSVSIEESFLGFLNVNDTTDQGLFDALQNELKTLDLDISDVRGQGYDNGSNMKGKYQATRWERRVESVKAIRSQMSDFREALLEVSEKDRDPKVPSDAKALAENELSSFEILVSIIIWYEILSAINFVSKLLQSNDMLIDVAMKKIKELVSFFERYRETGFRNALNSAKEIAIEMNIDPIFPQKRLIRRKKQFDENLNAPSVELSEEESFRVNYFLYLVDQAIVSLNKRFEQYEEYGKVFGFLFSSHELRSRDDASLKSCCSHLEDTLKHNDQSDINHIIS